MVLNVTDSQWDDTLDETLAAAIATVKVQRRRLG